MGAQEYRRGTVTEEHREEARRLKRLWDAAKEAGRIGSQAAFGDEHDIGNQAAVGFFLNGNTALSLKAAYGFAKGLGVPIRQFSPRLAQLAEEYAAVAGRSRPSKKNKNELRLRNLAVLADIYESRGGLRYIVDQCSSDKFDLQELTGRLSLPHEEGGGSHSEPLFPDDLVTALEQKFELGPGWFDTEGESVKMTPHEMELLSLYRRLSRELQFEVRHGLIQTVHEHEKLTERLRNGVAPRFKPTAPTSRRRGRIP